MRRISLLTLALCLLSVGLVHADPITVTSYNINNTPLSGFGAWGHTYNGTITPAGNGYYNYTGGSGTLNDGVIGTSHTNTHLFVKAAQPVISLFLNGNNQVNSFSLYSYDSGSSNGIPGNIVSLDVTINGVTNTILSTGFGPGGQVGPVHEFVLLGSGLNTLVTGMITLSNFQTTGNFPEYFSISEVQVEGNPVAVPVPAGFVLMGFAMVGLTGFRIIKRKSRLAIS